jgi:hypothetical protein
MGGGEAIQEGTQVREGQEILTIPSTGGMIAEASIHESVLNQVAIDLPCTITVDAIPGAQFKGKVRFVAPLPDKGNWWANPNQRLYRTEVSIEDASPEMRPGMNCSIEILVEEIPDAIYAPLQAIQLSKGKPIAFVAKGSRVEERSVVVGKQSDKWVQILEGLSEGEEVLLTPPPGFTPQKPETEGAILAGSEDAVPAPGAGPANGSRGPGEGQAEAGSPASGERGSGGGSGAGRGARGRRGEGQGPPGAVRPANAGGDSSAGGSQSGKQ